MAASVSTVLKRVTETLNACAAGTYSATIASTNLDRNATAISDAATEAAMMIARAILANRSHVHRNLFVGSSTALTHQGEMPDMAGEPDLIEIQPSSGADYRTGVMRDVQQIESFRANVSNIYGAVAHDAAGSRLAGYYAIAGGRFYFTGYAARGYFPSISNATVTTLIPDEYEQAWAALTIGLCVKEGDNLFDIAQYYFQHGLADLQAISTMGIVRALPTPEQAQQARGN